MTILLSNDDVQGLLTMEETLRAVEDAYRDLGQGRAANRPRSDLYSQTRLPDAFHIFKTMEGTLPSRGVVALRIDSNLVRWREVNGKLRKEGVPVATRNTFLGLVLLFSIENGELLAIMPDGYLQKMRVGATNGLAAKYLAPEDASKVGLLGSGWQAGAQLMALACVRHLRQVRVYSPNAAHREDFAREMTAELGLPVEPVGDPALAVEDADIIVSATNSIARTVHPDWVREGQFVTCVKYGELGPEVLARCDQVFVNSHHAAPETYLPGYGRRDVHDPVEYLMPGSSAMKGLRHPELAGSTADAGRRGEPDWGAYPELQDLIGGESRGRRSDGEVTCFVNNIGLGIQFAATGAVIYEAARRANTGREIPTEWFLQSLHP